MLTKKQLEDAARCTIIDCEDCSVYCVNTIEVTRRAARTALAYREMLEQLEWINNYCPICRQYKTNGHAPTCKLTALLKGNKAEETRGIVKLIETKPGYWECENCGESFECEPQKDKYNYCPCCGIKLDEYVSYVTDTKE
jgi:Zn finger protein HypA/HybF involved in hydrogenase expression